MDKSTKTEACKDTPKPEGIIKKYNIESVRNDETMDPMKKLFLFNFCALIIASAKACGNSIMNKGEMPLMLEHSMMIANVVLPQDEIDELLMKATSMVSDVGIYEE